MSKSLSNIYFIQYQGIARLLHHLLYGYPKPELITELKVNQVAETWPELAARDGNRIGREALANYLQQWDETQFLDLQLDYGQLFFGPGEPKAVPYGSVYLGEEQVLNDRSTLALMDFYQVHDVSLQLPARDPVDHIGLFFSVLDASFGRLAAEPDNQRLVRFTQVLLQQHLLPWAERCLELAAEHAQTEFYFAVALLARDFLLQLTEDFNLIPMPARLFR
ncbi:MULTISPECIES: molecular chaperone [Shewanella]|uniref:Molecular chaperone TorD family protein n=1 Tax=Shewanella indica TaxID=768528 RepID=A0ABU4QB03_9GAMM|nr:MULTISPECIES: molecular chaperone TorD family protein [Shewanella]MDX6016622.1 molecular chaperone TorD family protein [Shewanella indica]NDO75717.1 molecular chaperone TorD [Shewanella sp. SE1]